MEVAKRHFFFFLEMLRIHAADLAYSWSGTLRRSDSFPRKSRKGTRYSENDAVLMYVMRNGLLKFWFEKIFYKEEFNG